MNLLYETLYKTLFLANRFSDANIIDHTRKRIREKLALSLPQTENNILPVIELTPDQSKDFFSKYFYGTSPVIIRGAAKDSLCCKKWNIEYFKKRYGEMIITVKNEIGYNINEETFTTNLEDYLTNHYQDPYKYLSFFEILHQYPELLEDIPHQLFKELRGASNKGFHYHLFIGGPHSRSGIHSAMSANFFLMIEGRKRFRIFPRQCFPLLGIKTNQSLHNYSLINMDEDLPQEFSYYNRIPRWDFILEPGDFLFNPSWLFHCVNNLSTSIGLRCGLAHLKGSFKISTTQTINRLTGEYKPLQRTIKKIKGEQ
jgi:hypothetical protein